MGGGAMLAEILTPTLTCAYNLGTANNIAVIKKPILAKFFIMVVLQIMRQ
jgi:hypothetical protein